jgi:hypothetical protein
VVGRQYPVSTRGSPFSERCSLRFPTGFLKRWDDGLGVGANKEASTGHSRGVREASRGKAPQVCWIFCDNCLTVSKAELLRGSRYHAFT